MTSNVSGSEARPADPAEDGERALRRVGTVLLLLAAATPLVIWSGLAYPYVVPRGAWVRGVAAGTLVVLVLLLGTRRIRLRRPLDPVGLALAVYLGIGTAAGLAGVSPVHSLHGDLSRMGGLVTWAAFVALYFALTILPTPRAWRILLDATLGAGSVVGVLAILQVGLGRSPESLLGNEGYVGVVALLLTALSLHLRAAGPTGGWRRAAYALAAAVNVVTVVLSGERGPVLGLLVLALVAAGIVALLHERVPRWVRGLPLLLLLVAGAAMALRGTRVVEQVPPIARVVNTSLDDAGLGYRLLMWEAAVAEIGARPLIGIGMENFSVAFSRHFPPEVYRLYPGSTYVDRAHNAYLDAAVAGGIVGLLGFLAIWVAAFAALRHGWRSGRMSAGEIAPLAGGLAGYLTYLLFWFEDLSSSLVLFTLLALVGRRAYASAPVELLGPRRVNLLQRVSLGAAVALLLVLGYRHAVLPVLAATRVIPAVDASRGMDMETRLAAYRAATEVRAPEAAELVVSMAEYIEGSRGAMPEARAAVGRAVEVDAAIQHALERLDWYQARDPENDAWLRARSGVLSSAAIFHSDRRYLELAIRDVRSAVDLSPTRVGHLYHLSNLLLMGGDVARAEEALKEAERLDPLYGGTAHRAARLNHVLGRVSEAARMLRHSWGLGYFPVERRTMLQVMDALGQAARPGEGGTLVDDYLRARYAPGVRPTPADTADVRVVERGMELYRQAGQPARAAELGRRWNELTATSVGIRRSSAPSPR